MHYSIADGGGWIKCVLFQRLVSIPNQTVHRRNDTGNLLRGTQVDATGENSHPLGVGAVWRSLRATDLHLDGGEFESGQAAAARAD